MKKGKKTRRLISLLLALVLAISIPAGCQGTADTTAPSAGLAIADASQSYQVTIDVNPSIELTVKDGVVTGATAFNDDGQSILLNTSVQTLDANAAVTAIVKELANGGYINNTAEIEPYLIITVSNNGVTNAEMTEKLKESAEQTLEELKLECRIGTADATPEDLTAATQLNLSVGRYMLLKYIATKENITIEQAITTYGSMKIGELMDMYEGAEGLFKNENNGRGDFLENLTPEQKQTVNGAIKTFKSDLKAAEKVFHSTWKQIKDTYKKQIKTIKKNKGDPAAILAQLNTLKQSMLTERTSALNVLTASVNAAKEKCMTAVSAIPLPQDLFLKYLNQIAQKEIDKQEGFNQMLHEFSYQAEKSKDDEQENKTTTVTQNEEDEKGKPDKAPKENHGQGQSKDE